VNPAKLLGWRLFGFLLVLGGLELYLRSYTTFGQLVVTERSARLGWRMLPSQGRWSREGDVRETINAFGYRDREWAAPRRGESGWEKDASVLRVAVLGQSMTYGTSVRIEDTWPRALERRLAAELERTGGPRQALVMNFAVQGYTLEQMRNVLADDVLPFRPDVVLLPLHAGDILPMPPSTDEFDFRYRRPWFKTAIRDLMFRQIVNRWVPRPRPIVDTDDTGDPDSPPREETGGLIAIARARPRAPELHRYWAAAGQRLTEMDELLSNPPSRLALVVLPTLDQLTDSTREDARVQLDPWVRRRNETRAEPPIPILTPRAAFARAQETLTRAIAARFPEQLPSNARGMHILPPDLRAFDERLFLQQDVGHYNARGHRLLADEVFEQGRAAGLW
jgi:lysophospholipase L1-like esterase